MPQQVGILRICLLTVGFFAFKAALLFGAAGTWNWPAGWIYLAIHAAFVVLAVVLGDPRMLDTRTNWEPDAKLWDKILAPVSAVFFWFAPMVVAGLDVGRFHGTPPLPSWLAPTAFTIHILALAFAGWAMVSNPFFAKFVAVRPDDGHHAVSRGPYAHVRHPGYAGALLAFGVLPLALGSLWAILPLVIGLPLLVLRTAWEDSTLRKELPDYAEYATQVPWRLIPGVW